MTRERGRRLSGAAALAGRQDAELVILLVGQDGPGQPDPGTWMPVP